MNEPQTKPVPAAGMTPEQMKCALALAVGWKMRDETDSSPEELLYWTSPDGRRHIFRHNLPNYPEDANAALEIVEMMRERGFYWMGWKRFDEQYMVRFLSGAPDGPVHEAQAATLPLAICTAALKALGHLQ